MPPDRFPVPRDRLLLPLLMLGALFSSATFTSVSPFLTEIAADLNVSVGLAGQVTSVSSFAAVLAGLIVAPFAGSLPAKRVLATLLAIVGFGSIGSGLVYWFPALLAFQFLAGAASSMIAATGLMTLGAVCKDMDRRARQQGLLLGSVGLGALLITPMLRWVARQSSWQWALALYGSLALVAALLFVLLLPAMHPVHLEQQPPRSRIRDAASALKISGVGATITTSFLVWMTWGLIGTFLAGYFLHMYPGDDGMIATLWLADGLGYLIGATLGGIAIARIGRPERTLFIGLLALTATIVPFAWLTISPLATVVAFFVWVVAFGITTNNLIALYNRLGDRHATALLFLDSATAKIAILTGSIVGGVVIDTTDGYDIWAILLLVITVSTVLPVARVARTVTVPATTPSSPSPSSARRAVRNMT